MDGPFSAVLYPTNMRVTGRSFLAWTMLLLGHIEAALRHAEQALHEARQLSHRPTLALVLQCRCTLAQILLDRRGLEERAEEFVAAAAEQGFAFWSALGRPFRGWALAMGGEIAAGIAEIREGIAAQRATEAAVFTSYCLALLAEAQIAAGQPKEALDLLGEALHESAATGGRWYEAELLRRKGETLRSVGGEPAEVEAHLLHALRVAREQQARLWELRTATSLARFWVEQGSREKARDLLTPAYDWFTDGFDTPDLAAARLVIESLA
jgi:predicted ATPase